MGNQESVRKYANAVIDKVCSECGREFRQRRVLKPVCSSECKAARRRRLVPPTILTCGHCKKDFQPDKLSRKYCSSECSRASRRGRTTRKKGREYPHLQRSRIGECLNCGNEYRATGDYSWRQQRFCSFDCYSRYKGETSIEEKVRVTLEAMGIAFVQEKKIGEFRVDFLVGNDVVIEADGDYWHSIERVVQRDRARDKHLGGLGYRILRISETDIRKGHDVIQGLVQKFIGAKPLPVRGDA